jgi:antitoxin component YwqK of YwqJK toxin-antitoxin module
MDGKGVLYYPNNQIAYDGEWKEDQLQGYGTLYNEEVGLLNVPFDYKNWEDVDEYWIRYEGHFI